MFRRHYSHSGGKSVHSEFRVNGILFAHLSLLFAVSAIFNAFSREAAVCPFV